MYVFTILQKYPDDLVPSFKLTVCKLYDKCSKLSLKILEAMGYALKLKVCCKSLIFRSYHLSKFDCMLTEHWESMSQVFFVTNTSIAFPDLQDRQGLEDISPSFPQSKTR